MKKPTWNPDNPDDPKNRIPGSGPNGPFIVTQKKIPVRTRTGSAVPVDNPMFNFALPKNKNFGQYGVENNKKAPWIRRRS